mgnify:CR=1 FL=1
MPNGSKRDIWERGIDTIMNWCKRNLLEYVEAIMDSSANGKERDRLIRIKKSIHQNVTQAQLQMATLFSSFRHGGTIDVWEDIMRPDPPQQPIPSTRSPEAEAIFGPGIGGPKP